MEINRFNVRAYGLLEHEGRMLLVHENMDDAEFTKFPGGGLEFGEGLKDCVVREFKEETGLRIGIASHFYTTDFFQQSAFRKSDQLISVYYKVTAIDDPTALRLDAFEQDNNGRPMRMRFFWVNRNELHPSMLTFAVDKLVCEMLGREA